MAFTTALLNVQPHNFGVAQTARSLPPRNAKVALSGGTDLLELEMNTADPVTGVFEGVRFSYLRIACSATWRIEGTGENPLLAEHFEGGVYPSGTLAWSVGQIGIGAAFTLAAANPPVVPLTGRIVLETLVDCEVPAGQGELAISVTAVEIGVGDAVVSLNVPFAEIDFDLGSDFLPGVNLAGAEFAHDNEANIPGVRDGSGVSPVYTYPTAAEMTYFAGKGMKLFRIPFIFRRLFRSPALVPSDLSLLLALIDHADTLGCTVLLDPHEYAEVADVGFTTPAVAAQFVAWWAQLITALAGRTNVIAGLMNEPRPVGQTAGISPANWLTLGINPLIAAIRTAGFTGLIAVPGTSWTGAHSWVSSGNAAAINADTIVDPLHNYVIEVHQYLDTDSSGTSDTITLGAGGTRLAAFTTWARAQGLRAILGEIGWPDPEGNVEGTAALLYCQNNRDVWLGWCIWAAGPWWGSYSYSVEPANLSTTPIDAGQMAVITPKAAAGASLVYPFLIERSGETGIACSVQAKVEGTGSNPITGAMFVGNVLPTITASFAADATRYLGALEFDAGSTRPAGRLTGRIVLRAPVDCRPDPVAAERAFALNAVEAPAVGPYDLVPANWVVHAPAGASGRVTWLPGGGFEVTGAANTDAFNIALWCLTPPPTNYELAFEYEKNEDLAAVDGGGRFAQVWGRYKGTAPRPVDVTAWTTANYRLGGAYSDVDDATYGDQGEGWRNSFDTETTDASNRNQVRLVLWDEGTDTRPDPTPDPPAMPMSGDGSAYDMTWHADGEILEVTNEDDGRRVKWETPLLGSLGTGGRMGFRWGRGRGGIIRPRPGVAVVRDLGTIVDPPPVSGSFPLGPWRVWNRGAATGRRVRVNSIGALRSAIADAQSSDQILLPVGGNITITGGDLVIGKSVSGTDAYYIATDTDSEDPASFCTLTGNILWDGARRAVLHGVKHRGRCKWDTAELCQMECVDVTGVSSDDGYSNPYMEITGARNNTGFKNNLIGFFYYHDNTATFARIEQSIRPTQILMSHNHTDRLSGTSYIWNPGNNPGDGQHSIGGYFQYFLDTGRSGPNDYMEMKFGGVHFRHFTIHMANHPNQQTKMRQGFGCTFEGFLYIQTGSNSPLMSVRGHDNTYLNNWCVRLSGDQLPTLDSALGNGTLQNFIGATDGETFPPGGDWPGGCFRRCSAYGSKIGGNRGFRVFADGDGGCSEKRDWGGPWKPADCIVTQVGKGRNTAVSTTNWINPDYTTQLPGADYDKVPIRLFPADVGPRAWRRQFASVYTP